MGPNTAWDLKTNSRGTQTDLVSDKNIAECLLELKSTPEFHGLTYRVSETCSGEVTLTVTRSDAVGLLGVPIDPVTVIVTSSGLCYVSALFSPLEVIDLKPNGHFVLRLFRNILRKLNGRAGFGFCPGFKEQDFPSGFQFEKHGLELIKQPFIRISAKGCPVFYQQKKPRPGGQGLGLELCTRCLQVGMGVCDVLKESGAEGEVPDLVKSLTKTMQYVPCGEQCKREKHASLDKPSSPDASDGEVKPDPCIQNAVDASDSVQNSMQEYHPKKQKLKKTANDASDSEHFPSAAATSSAAVTTSTSNISDIKQPPPPLSPTLKPWRFTTAPQLKAETSASNISLPILRLKRCDSENFDSNPPLLTAETAPSTPSTPQLCIDEDADPETLEPAVDGEPDAKRQCLRCSLCSEMCTSQMNLRQHLQEKHPEDTTNIADEASADSTNVMDPTSPLQHAEGVGQSQPQYKTCPVCKQKFADKDALEAHLRERHNTRLHRCRYCGQKFALKTNLSSHLLSHMGSAHLKCQECGAKFSSKKKYAKHIRDHMGSLPFFCRICTKHFSREKTYGEHMDRHKTRRAMKSLVGTEKTTQAIMDRARRFMEDKAQMELSVPEKNDSSVLSHTLVKTGVCHDNYKHQSVPDNDKVYSQLSNDTDKAESDGSHHADITKDHTESVSPPISEPMQTETPVSTDSLASSNLELLSTVSLAQAELDQAYTIKGQCQGTVNSQGDTDSQRDREPRSSQDAQNLTRSSCNKENEEKIDTHAGVLPQGHADSLPGLTSVASNIPSCSSSHAASLATSPSRSQNSPVSQTDSHSGISERQEDMLKEIEERERKIQQKEQELKEREVTIAKKNLVLFQQLLMAHMAQQPRPPGQGQPRPEGTVFRGLPVPPVLANMLKGVGPRVSIPLRTPGGIATGQMFRAPVPGAVNVPGSLRPPVPLGPRGPLGPHGPCGTGGQQGSGSASQLGSELGNSKGSTSGGVYKRRRPNTTPTPPPPDAPPNFLTTSKGSTSRTETTLQKSSSPSNTQTNNSTANSPSGPSAPALRNLAALQELWKLESKMPESAKEFLPSAKRKKQYRFHNYEPPKHNIPDTVVAHVVEEPTPSSGSKSRRQKSQSVAGGEPDSSRPGGWSGGTLMGKDKLRSPNMVIPPKEMQRIMSLTKPLPPLPPPSPSPSVEAILSAPVRPEGALRSPLNEGDAVCSPGSVHSHSPASVHSPVQQLPLSGSERIAGTAEIVPVSSANAPATADGMQDTRSISGSSATSSVRAERRLHSSAGSDRSQQSSADLAISQHSSPAQPPASSSVAFSPSPPRSQHSCGAKSTSILAGQLAAAKAAMIPAFEAGLSSSDVRRVIAPLPREENLQQQVQISASVSAQSPPQSLLQSVSPTLPQHLRPPPGPASAPSMPSRSTTSQSLPQPDMSVTVASTKTVVSHAPPPLYLPNAAGGLPIPMPTSDEDVAPIDLTKHSNRSTASDRSSEPEKNTDKTAGSGPVDLSSHSSVLLRQYLSEVGQARVGNSEKTLGLHRVPLLPLHSSPLREGLGPLREAVGPLREVAGPLRDSAGLLREGGGNLKEGSGIVRPQLAALQRQAVVLQQPVSSLPPQHTPILTQHGILTTSGIAVSLQDQPTSQAPPLSSPGPMAPLVQMPVRPLGPQPRPASRPLEQVPVLLHQGMLRHRGRQEDVLSRVRLSHVSGDSTPISEGVVTRGDEGVPTPRYTIPAHGGLPPHSIVSSLPANTSVSSAGGVAPPSVSFHRRMASPPRPLISPPLHSQQSDSVVPPNFLLARSMPHTDTRSGDRIVNTLPVPRSVSEYQIPNPTPLGGFTWHRPAVAESTPQSTDREDRGVDTNSIRQDVSVAEEREGDADVRGSREQISSPVTAAFSVSASELSQAAAVSSESAPASAWQEQFLQTLKRQRRHTEQQQRAMEAKQQKILQRISQEAGLLQHPQPPARSNKRSTSRSRKKKNDTPQTDAASNTDQPGPSFPNHEAPHTAEKITEGPTVSSTNVIQNDMPQVSDTQPIKRPRKRPARKRKQTRKVDVNVVDQEVNTGEDMEKPVEHTEEPLSCDECGRVLLNEADILHHKCSAD